MTTATDRFKKRYVDAVELICILEEKLEEALARVAELEKQPDKESKE